MVSRSEAIEKIEQQRQAIREHIAKYERDKGTVHESAALKTIKNAQAQIEKWKSRASSPIPSAPEDTWTAD